MEKLPHLINYCVFFRLLFLSFALVYSLHRNDFVNGFDTFSLTKNRLFLCEILYNKYHTSFPKWVFLMSDILVKTPPQQSAAVF